MAHKIEISDVIEWARSYDGPKFHALLCDPPYELGFMGKDWDKSGIGFNSETWAALSGHLYPGAFIMSFSSSRGWHRLAVAIEDAGFIFHPSIMMWGWAMGSGFPKSTRIDTQIDKAANKLAEREVVGEKKLWGHNAGTGAGSFSKNAYEGMTGEVRYEPITEPATDLAKAWEGHRYGRQSLKPAVEMILCAQNPYKGRPITDITETGAGALWIDGGRIGSEGGETHSKSVEAAKGHGIYGSFGPVETNRVPKGRWPANFVLCHHPECVRVGARKVKNRSGSVSGTEPSSPILNVYNEYDRTAFEKKGDADGNEIVAVWECVPSCSVKKLGEQARYFFQSDWSHEIQEQLEQSDPVFYCAKASRKERDAGLEKMNKQKRRTMGNGLTGVSGDRSGRGGATKNLPMGEAMVRNPHPTVKPIKLAQWLATLLLPPQEYAPRRILVPFAGTGSEMIGALLVGWEHILGIEMDEKYCELARARLGYWASKPRQTEMDI